MMKDAVKDLDDEINKGALITKEYFWKFLKVLKSEDRIKVKNYLLQLKHEQTISLIGYMVEFEQSSKKISKRELMDGIKGEFHITSYQTNVENFYTKQPFFYDKARIFWFWNHEEYKYEIVDETDIMRYLDNELGFCGQTVSSTIKSNYIESFKRVGRDKHPMDAKIKWVQFKNKAYSLSGKIHDVTPDYFFTNPIPWEIGETSETPVMDSLFESWVGKEYVDTLYEILAYCCYRSYPIQLLFSLCGCGRNGKSQYLKIIDKFIGEDNTVSTELDRLLNNRFESFKLYKKLVCVIGETNFSVLSQSSMLKKLTGGDKIGFEKKNKDPFDDYNYAKPIIASNSLPSSNDTSDGFYRRWFIIDFPNEFKENGHDIVEDIPEQEYNNLAKKVCEILPKLLKDGRFTNQGSIVQRKEKYIEQSNPLQKFIQNHCEINEDNYILYSRLYTHYTKYLLNHKKRKVKMKEFKSALEDEGLFVEKDSKKEGEEWKSGYYVQGIRFLDNFDNLDNNLTSFYTHGKLSESVVQNVKNVQNEEIVSENP